MYIFSSQGTGEARTFVVSSLNEPVWRTRCTDCSTNCVCCVLVALVDAHAAKAHAKIRCATTISCCCFIGKTPNRHQTAGNSLLLIFAAARVGV